MADRRETDAEAQVVDMLSRRQIRSATSRGDGGGGGMSGDMDRRVTALEKGVEKLDGKIDKLTELVSQFGLKTSERLGQIESRLTGMEKTLDAKATKTDLTPIEVKLGTVDGKVSNLPTTAVMVTLVLTAVALSLGGAAGLAFTLFKLFGPIAHP